MSYGGDAPQKAGVPSAPETAGNAYGRQKSGSERKRASMLNLESKITAIP